MFDFDNISHYFCPWTEDVISSRSRSHCTYIHYLCLGHNFLLSCWIWIIFHTIVVLDQRVCHINTKTNNSSSNMPLDQCYSFSLTTDLKKFFEEGAPPWPILALPWIRPWVDLSKNNNTCKGPRVLHPYQDASKSIERFLRRGRKCK